MGFLLILRENVYLKGISTDKWDVRGCYKENNHGVECGQWDLGKYSVISNELLTLEISQNNDKFSYLLSQGRKNKNCSY